MCSFAVGSCSCGIDLSLNLQRDLLLYKVGRLECATTTFKVSKSCHTAARKQDNDLTQKSIKFKILCLYCTRQSLVLCVQKIGVADIQIHIHSNYSMPSAHAHQSIMPQCKQYSQLNYFTSTLYCNITLTTAA